MVPPPPELARIERQRAVLAAARKRRRRLAGGCFFLAGIGFGTALYLLRARFSTLHAPGQRAAFVALVGVMIALFWLGARAESEIGKIEEELRDLEEAAQALRRR